ncbi:hypothetical protein KDH_12580 [Dictyobacter sp. S3.2.2.5]|uniref:Uncharacterized protein n=2 Tax=Dictyobacter halimunensis TaxID=3026934 RepID=A0ABQ6FJL6_9CHLR|nr:hypothetical protein KDH_12580 [Dictyobacter sp. S3.2.2.5]
MISSSSNYGPLSLLIAIQGIVAFLTLLVLWWVDRISSPAMLLLSLVAFVSLCLHMHTLRDEYRQQWYLYYSLLAFILLGVELLGKPGLWTHFPLLPAHVWPLFLLELLAVLAFLIAYLLCRAVPDNLSPQQRQQRQIRVIASPAGFALHVLRLPAFLRGGNRARET